MGRGRRLAPRTSERIGTFDILHRLCTCMRSPGVVYDRHGAAKALTGPRVLSVAVETHDRHALLLVPSVTMVMHASCSAIRNTLAERPRNFMGAIESRCTRMR